MARVDRQLPDTITLSVAWDDLVHVLSEPNVTRGVD
jgi:hypothetical protein